MDYTRKAYAIRAIKHLSTFEYGTLDEGRLIREFVADLSVYNLAYILVKFAKHLPKNKLVDLSMDLKPIEYL